MRLDEYELGQLLKALDEIPERIGFEIAGKIFLAGEIRCAVARGQLWHELSRKIEIEKAKSDVG